MCHGPGGWYVRMHAYQHENEGWVRSAGAMYALCAGLVHYLADQWSSSAICAPVRRTANAEPAEPEIITRVIEALAAGLLGQGGVPCW
jgi:hypothetical protein